MFTAAKNFNANYDKAMEDIRTPEKSSALLADLKGHMEVTVISKTTVRL